MADTSVVFLHSAMAGAPALSGQAGKMLDVLNACLVDGWGTTVVDSVVITGGVGRVNRSAGHPFEVDMVAELSGATVTGGSINGRQKVLSIDSTGWTFDATGIANQTATGTISYKIAAAGWTRAFSTVSNVACYRSPNVASNRAYLRVDDSGTTHARVVGYEAMSDLNTGTGPFPNSAQVSGGLYWGKSSTADAAARPWTIFANDRTFYLYVAYTNGSPNTFAALGFGDFLSEKSPDAYGSFLSGHSINSEAAGAASANEITFADAGANGAIYFPRSASGVGSSTQGRRYAFIPVANTSTVAGLSGRIGAGWINYPNPGNNALYVTPIFVAEAPALIGVRGRLPGIYFNPQQTGTSAFATRERTLNVASLPGRALRAMNNSAGPSFVDVTGSWF